MPLRAACFAGSPPRWLALLNYRHPREFWRQVMHGAPTPILYAVMPHFEEQAQNLKKRKPDAWTEVFETAGHALFVDEAARFNALLDDFLFARLPAARAVARR